MKLPHKTLEKNLFRSGYQRIYAVDEVGVGCLAGPVVVCAVAFTPKFFEKRHRALSWLRDSKLLASRQREKFVREFKSGRYFKFHIGYCYPKTIDRVNIYQAARLAMKRAIARLETSDMRQAPKSIVLVDGPHKIARVKLPQQPIVKGDRNVFAIACASVIAKVFRDRMMDTYAKKYPGYGFEKHKGYSTKYHKAQLAMLGPSPIHRRSFAPVGRMI